MVNEQKSWDRDYYKQVSIDRSGRTVSVAYKGAGTTFILDSGTSAKAAYRALEQLGDAFFSYARQEKLNLIAEIHQYCYGTGAVGEVKGGHRAPTLEGLQEKLVDLQRTAVK